MKYTSKMTAGMLSGIIAVSMFSLCNVSCNRDNDDPIDEPQVIREPQMMDDLEFLRSNLYTVDEYGNLASRINGMPLDMTDTTVVSIATGTMTDAEETFLSWLSVPERAQKTAQGYIYEMRNVKGDSIGMLSFNTVGLNEGVLASMTYETAKPLQYVSEVQFLVKWPENATSPYKLDTEVKVGDYTFRCLQEAANGKAGLLIGLTKDSHKLGEEHLFSTIEQNLMVDRMMMMSLIRTVNKDNSQKILANAGIDLNTPYMIRTIYDNNLTYGIASFAKGIIEKITAEQQKGAYRGLQLLTFVVGSDFSSGMIGTGSSDMPGAGNTTSEDNIQRADSPMR